MHSSDKTSQPSNLKSGILQGLVKLPPMPQIILKVRETMANPNAGLRDVVRIIEKDQALVARVLALANSAYYGLSGKVSSIQHAAVLLGLNTLGDLIAMSAAAVLLTRELAGYRLDPQTLWKHSLSSAICSREIALRRFPGTEADAFVVGLLHDAGKIILDPYLCNRQDALAVQGAITETQEIEWLGVDHAEIMALACRFWRFPEAQVRGIRYHHHPSQSAQSALAYVAHLGHALSQRAGLSAAAKEAAIPEDGTLEFLKFQPNDLDDMQNYMIQEMKRLEETLR